MNKNLMLAFISIQGIRNDLKTQVQTLKHIGQQSYLKDHCLVHQFLGVLFFAAADDHEDFLADACVLVSRSKCQTFSEVFHMKYIPSQSPVTP